MPNIPRVFIWFIAILIIFALAAVIESMLKSPAPAPAIIQAPVQVPVTTPVPTQPNAKNYSYLGCYFAPWGGYNLKNALGGKPVSVDVCRLAASNVGAKYFAIGNSHSDGTGACYYGNDYGANGKAANCITRDSQDNLLGGLFAQATYEVV